MNRLERTLGLLSLGALVLPACIDVGFVGGATLDCAQPAAAWINRLRESWSPKYGDAVVTESGYVAVILRDSGAYFVALAFETLQGEDGIDVTVPSRYSAPIALRRVATSGTFGRRKAGPRHLALFSPRDASSKTNSLPRKRSSVSLTSRHLSEPDSTTTWRLPISSSIGLTATHIGGISPMRTNSVGRRTALTRTCPGNTALPLPMATSPTCQRCDTALRAT
jgi:hypothetical protein